MDKQLRFAQLRFATVLLIAGATIAVTTAPVWAFSQQTVLPNGNYDFNYGALDNDKSMLLSDSVKKNDPNSPGFHFNIESGRTDNFGFRSIGGPGLGSRNGPPDYYSQPPGNGN